MMKIAPVSTVGMTVQAPAPEGQVGMVQKVRAMKMNTNATPGRVDEESLTIPGNNEGTNEPEVTAPLSPQLAALAKQRRALQVKEREILAREKALSEKSATQAGGVDLARLKSDPLGVLLENGVTYDQLTEAVLANNSGITPEITALKAKIKELEEGFDKKLTDRDSQQEQQALAEMRREALLIVGQGDEYELVRETRSVPKVMELIEKTYRKTGEVLDVREALRLVEEELTSDAMKLAALQKVQRQLAPPPAPTPPQKQPMRTLTNRDTASVPLSAKARAIAAFNGTLRK